MRHRVAHRKLGRTTEHRIALLRNQAEALLRHERIETTVPKAKELRPFVEKLITIAKRGVQANDPKGRTLSAKRLVGRDVLNPEIVAKLFDDVALRFTERPGGYTRILKLGHRRGDGGETALIELVGSEYDPKKAAAAKAKQEEAGDGPKTQKSVGERLRSAAKRITGGGKQEKAPKGEGGKSKTSRQAHPANRRSTTPRKAGGS